MNQQAGQRVKRTGHPKIETTLEAEEVHKSKLILETQLLREQARTDEAAAKFAVFDRRNSATNLHIEFIFSPDETIFGNMFHDLADLSRK